LMTVPLVQGSLRYAYKIGVQPSERSQKNAAEGAVFTAAVLPLVANCSATAAETISSQMKFGLFDAGTYPSFTAVKQAFESTYSCLGITCAQVGALSNGGLVDAQAAACTASTPYTPLVQETFPPGVVTETVHQAAGSFVAAGDVASAPRSAIADTIARHLGVSSARVQVAISAASVLVNFHVEYPTPAEANAAITSLSTQMSTTAAATSFFSSAGLSVTTAPMLFARPITRAVGNSTNNIPAWGIALLVAVSVLAAALLVMVAHVIKMEKRGKPIFLPLSPIVHAGVGMKATTSTDQMKVDASSV